MLPKRIKRHQHEFKCQDGQVIKYTPWLVKNEQEFMYAIEGIERAEIGAHIEELISKCVQDVDLNKLSDVDYLRLAIEIRCTSKGAEHELGFTCPDCGEINSELIIDLSEDARFVPFDAEPIEIADLTFEVKELSKAEVFKLSQLKTNEEKRFQFIVHSIKSIAVGDEIFPNLSTEDIEKYLGEELENLEFKELVENVILKTSTVAIDKTFKCKKCKKEIKVYVDDIIDFFV